MLMGQAVTMFDSMMKEVVDQAGGLSSQNSELCSLLRNILQVCLIAFFFLKLRNECFR